MDQLASTADTPAALVDCFYQHWISQSLVGGLLNYISRFDYSASYVIYVELQNTQL